MWSKIYLHKKTSEVFTGKNGISRLHSRVLGLWSINLYFSNKFPSRFLWLLKFENYCFNPSVLKTHCSHLSQPPSQRTLPKSRWSFISNTWILLQLGIKKPKLYFLLLMVIILQRCYLLTNMSISDKTVPFKLLVLSNFL